jgi:cation:H+ antiporter
MVAFGLLIGGLVLLVFGAEWLVRGASQLAARAGISPLAIGLTVVAYGTSTPELAVSVNAALSGQADIAVGNVVGSNICNVLLILGVSALAAPLIVSSQLVRLDVPLMIAVSLGTIGLALDGRISRLDGLILLVVAIGYTVLQLVLARRESSIDADAAPPSGSVVASILYIVVGLGLLMLGASWMVSSAVTIAKWWGVSELVIGLTVVAVGTSLPELMTSVVASLRGQRDIAVGNIVGSNIFNLTAVLGASAAISPMGVAVAAETLRFDLPVMTAVAVICLPIFFTGSTVARWEGALLLAYYVAYVTYLVMAAQRHDATEGFGDAMRYFVLPITAAVFVGLAIMEFRRRRSDKLTPITE